MLINFNIAPGNQMVSFQNDKEINYVELFQTIKEKCELFGEIIENMRYCDEEGDLINITCQNELDEFYRILKLQPKHEMDLFIQLKEKKFYSLEDDEVPVISENKKKIEEVIIDNHMMDCSECGKNIVGIRWKCLNCFEYNLCSGCEQTSSTLHHTEHVYIKLPRPQTNKIDFKPQRKLFYANTEGTDQKKKQSQKKEKKEKKFDAKLVDETSSDDIIETFANMPFKKKWRIKNTGATWSNKIELRCESGDLAVDEPIKNSLILMKGKETDFLVKLISPSQPGHYSSFWRLFHSKRGFFGPKFHFELVVKKDLDYSVIYAKQLDKLISYGFKEQAKNLDALIRSNGQVSEAINLLLYKK